VKGKAWSAGRSPYLRVVVTSRNDDHGGDPLKRLQTFVNCFDAQCRRTGLDAEVIIVEWNPLREKPRLQTLVRFHDPCSSPGSMRRTCSSGVRTCTG